MAGYSRQSAADIIANAVIKAAPVNAEYNAIRDAFALSGGHKHDGSSTEGAYVPLIADTDALNKVVIDTSNNRIGFFSEVSSAAVEQIRIQDGAIVPVTDNDIDLGTSSLEFKDLFIDGTATIDTLTVDESATITANLTVNGNTTLGNAATDTVTLTADVASAITPSADDTHDLGAVGSEWRNLYVDGQALIDDLVADTADINGGTIDGAIIGGNSAAAGTFTDLTASGTTTITTADINGGAIDGVTIGANSAGAATFTTVTASGAVVINGGLTMDTNKFTVADTTGNTSIGGTLGVTGAVTANAGVVIDNITIDGTEIDLSSGDLTVDVAGDIILDADGGDFKFQDGGTEILRITNSSSDVVIRPVVDAKDIIFQQRDGTEVARIEDNGTFNVVTDKLAINGTAVTSTAAEINILDGDTSATSTTVADADRVVLNDNGTMVQVAVTDLAAYFDDEITAMPNLVTTAATTVGALNSGSITSGFGSIDTGSSTITTTGNITGGNLIISDGGNIGSSSDTDAISIASGGNVTMSQNLTVTGDLTVSGTTTTVNSTTVTIDDPVFTIGGDTAPSSDDNKDRGIEFRYHTGSAAKVGFFGFDDSTGKFTFIPDATNSSEVFSGTAGTIAANVEGDLTGTLQTPAQGNVTSLGTLTALTVDDVAVDGKVITMTGSTDDTATLTVGTNGTLAITTTDTAAAAANITITADGTFEAVGTTVTLDSSGGINLETDALSVGNGGDTDVVLTFNANSNDGVITWMEDEDYFKYSDNILMDSTNKIQFGDTASFIHQSADGTLTIDGEAIIDLNASTRVDVSGDIKVGGEVQTAKIAFTDGDDAITIADGGGITANTSLTLASGSTVTSIKDEDDFTSNSDTALATQQSIRAYVNTVAGQANNVTGLSATGAQLNTVAHPTTIGNNLDTSTVIANNDAILIYDNSASVPKYFDVDLLDNYYATTTKTLTNKTLTSPVVTGLKLNDAGLTIEGSSANDFETVLNVTDPTADRTITFPDATGTVVTTANLSAITSTGTLTSLTVDDITIDGSTISDGGDLTIDVGATLNIDADTQIILKDNGTSYGTFYQSSSDFYIQSLVQDKDIVFYGNDGGSGITALTLDMSDAGTATFNHDIKLGDNGKAIFGAGSDLQIYHDGSNSYIKDAGTGNLNVQGENLALENTSGDNYLVGVNGSFVKLYFSGSEKLATTSAGIDVTGTVTADGLTVDGDVSVTGDTFTITSSAQDDPVLLIQNTTNDSNSARLKFNKDRGAAAQDGDDIADIIFAGENDAQQAVTYGAVRVEATDVSDGSEDGKITFQSMTAGTLTDTLSMQSGNVSINNIVDAENFYADYAALSGTTPTIDADTGGGFSLTMSGNTTFTFSSVESGKTVGFYLEITGNGSTVDYESNQTVKFAGGTAPDAPANGETDILVFVTRDGGTNWYGALAIDAAA